MDYAKEHTTVRAGKMPGSSRPKEGPTKTGKGNAGHPKEGTTLRSDKNIEQTGRMPMPGVKPMPGKSHEQDIAWGEGLPLGTVHPAHEKHSPVQVKHNRAPHAASHAQRNRAIMGNADPMGGREMMPTKQHTGFGGKLVENPGVHQKAYKLNKRSELGGANPTAVAGQGTE
jgi:hypothetical protein